jgi:MFS family permease
VGVSAIATAGFVAGQRRAAAPLVDLALLRSRTVATGLVGALCGYLVLFGPLVLVPIVLTSAGSSELHAGLVLTALPAGFALAAIGADRLLPRSWSDRTRAALGAAVSGTALLGLLATPPTTPWLVTLLALLGLALGIFTPANNTLIMSTVPTRAAATAGGLVSMSRSLGTALGVALVTLALSIGTGHAMDGPRAAVLVLATAAGVALFATRLAPAAVPTQ